MGLFLNQNIDLDISKSLSADMSDLLDYTQEYLDQNEWLQKCIKNNTSDGI